MIDVVFHEKVLFRVYLRTFLDFMAMYLGITLAYVKILSHCYINGIAGICKYDTTQANMTLVCVAARCNINGFSYPGYKNDIYHKLLVLF